MSASDAQRKIRGNQRGAITLVQGDLRGQIDQRTYFRYDLFESASWMPTVSGTGKPMDRTLIPMAVSIDGVSKGIREVGVTYAPNRESAQHNYTSTLHIESLTTEVQQRDLTGRKLLIEALSDQTFRLSIQ